MEGFYKEGTITEMSTKFSDGKPSYTIEQIEKSLPISWDVLKPDPLHVLLDHSDCGDDIECDDCGPLADRLEELLPELEKAGSGGGHIGSYVEATKRWIDGLRLAVERQENVSFG